jgi:hypothetical protein
MSDDDAIQNPVVETLENKMKRLTSAYEAVIEAYGHSPENEINTEAMTNAIEALEALSKPLANEMTSEEITSGGKYRRTRRNRRTRRTRRHRKAKRSKKTRM